MANSYRPEAHSDRSLFSMVVDAAVSRPERHSRVFAHVPVSGEELVRALEVLKREFGRVEWERLPDAQQVKQLEEIQAKLRSMNSTPEKLAVHALHWGLQNRKHRRQAMSTEAPLNEDELDEFSER